MDSGLDASRRPRMTTESLIVDLNVKQPGAFAGKAIPFSRRKSRPSLWQAPCPLPRRGRRECRVHAAPAVSCAVCAKESAHEHTGSAEAVRHPLRDGLTAYTALSPATNSSCHRHCRLLRQTIRSDRFRHRQLGTSNGCQDHTASPYANSAVRLARAWMLTASRPASTLTRLALSRPTHPVPRS